MIDMISLKLQQFKILAPRATRPCSVGCRCWWSIILCNEGADPQLSSKPCRPARGLASKSKSGPRFAAYQASSHLCTFCQEHWFSFNHKVLLPVLFISSPKYPSDSSELHGCTPAAFQTLLQLDLSVFCFFVALVDLHLREQHLLSV